MIRHRNDFVQTMRNEHDGNALRCDDPHRLEQPFRFALREHSRRLVKNQKLDARLVDFSGYFDKLHISDRQSLYFYILFYVKTDRIKRFSGVLSHAFSVQALQGFPENMACDARCRDFASNFNVFSYSKTRYQHKLLVNHTDAELHGLLWVFNRDRLAVYADTSRKPACIMDNRHSKQHVHQR